MNSNYHFYNIFAFDVASVSITSIDLLQHDVYFKYVAKLKCLWGILHNRHIFRRVFFILEVYSRAANCLFILINYLRK